MPELMPSIWDILGYEEEGEMLTKGSRQQYTPGGQGDMLSYLSGLLEESDWMTDEMKSPCF